MNLPSVSEKIPLEADINNVIHIGGTRVTLDSIIYAFSEGATAEEIIQQYPSLQLADVYYVIGYYLNHKSEVESHLQEQEKQGQIVRQQNEKKFDPHGLRERLLARRKG